MALAGHRRAGVVVVGPVMTTDYQSYEKQFGQLVRAYRKQGGLTQAEVAAWMTRVGFVMHQTTMARIERGTRPIRMAEAAALIDLLGIPSYGGRAYEYRRNPQTREWEVVLLPDQGYRLEDLVALRQKKWG